MSINLKLNLAIENIDIDPETYKWSIAGVPFDLTLFLGNIENFMLNFPEDKYDLKFDVNKTNDEAVL